MVWNSRKGILAQIPAYPPTRITMLLSLAERIVEEGRSLSPSEGTFAHTYLLEALCLVDGRGEDDLLLSVLHRLTRIEWQLAKALRRDPPCPGIYFSLAQHHYHQALPLYDACSNSVWCRDAKHLGKRLAAKARSWSPRSLRAAWFRPISPLHDLMLLGLAAAAGIDDFVDFHAWKVREAIAASWDASTRCEQLSNALEEMAGVADASTRDHVIAPWQYVVEEVYR